jgi:hypothetical protein
MKALRAILAVIFTLATILGVVAIPVIAAYTSIWVLYPIRVVLLGFVAHFLGEGMK